MMGLRKKSVSAERKGLMYSKSDLKGNGILLEKFFLQKCTEGMDDD